MKSLELIRRLNEKPVLHAPGGMTAGQFCSRIKTLIDLGHLDRDAPVVFADLAHVISIVADDDGELLVLSDE